MRHKKLPLYLQVGKVLPEQHGLAALHNPRK